MSIILGQAGSLTIWMRPECSVLGFPCSLGTAKCAKGADIARIEKFRFPLSALCNCSSRWCAEQAQRTVGGTPGRGFWCARRVSRTAKCSVQRTGSTAKAQGARRLGVALGKSKGRIEGAERGIREQPRHRDISRCLQASDLDGRFSRDQTKAVVAACVSNTRSDGKSHTPRDVSRYVAPVSRATIAGRRDICLLRPRRMSSPGAPELTATQNN